jgi:Component of IIS longevity pathway SMK-1
MSSRLQHVNIFSPLVVELCDRKVIEFLLNDMNFLSVVGVFGYNPGLIREMDFRSELESASGFKEVSDTHCYLLCADDPHANCSRLGHTNR